MCVRPGRSNRRPCRLTPLHVSALISPSQTVCDSVSTYPPNAGTSSFPPNSSEAASSSSSVRSPPVFLERFIPLLAERIYVISPKTRNHLVSWITVLDSVPELELITYLPSFLDGLLCVAGAPTEPAPAAD